MEAERNINNQDHVCRVILALERELPLAYTVVKNLLGIEVIENIRLSTADGK